MVTFNNLALSLLDGIACELASPHPLPPTMLFFPIRFEQGFQGAHYDPKKFQFRLKSTAGSSKGDWLRPRPNLDDGQPPRTEIPWAAPTALTL